MSKHEGAHGIDRLLELLHGGGHWGDSEGLEAAVDNRRQRYAVLPRRAEPKALVPTWPPAVTAAVMHNYITPMSSAGRVRAAALVKMARMGLIALWPHSVRVGLSQRSGLVGHLSQRLTHDVVAGVYLGPPRANRKPVLQLLTKEGQLVAFVKVSIDDFTKARVANEADALVALGQRSFDSLVVPGVLAEGTWRGHRYLALTPVTTRSDTATNRRSIASAELSRSFGVEESRLSEAGWWRETVRVLTTMSCQEARSLRELAINLEERRGDTTLELGAAHGDWSPWNTATVGGKVVAWDWERFRPRVPIGWDAVHFAAERHRLSGVTADASYARITREAATITRGCGSQINDPQLVFATYLLDLGRPYLADSEVTGVQPRGPITNWLLGPLGELVRIVTARVRS